MLADVGYEGLYCFVAHEDYFGVSIGDLLVAFEEIKCLTLDVVFLPEDVDEDCREVALFQFFNTQTEVELTSIVELGLQRDVVLIGQICDVLQRIGHCFFVGLSCNIK